VSNVKDAYERPFKVTIENKMRSFQFKMNIKETPQCKHCLFQNETLVHKFLEQPVVEPFWIGYNMVG